MPRSIDHLPAPLLEVTWPEALPHPEEDRFLSVVCEKQALWWCLHAKDAAAVRENSSSYPWRITMCWKVTTSLLETPRNELTLTNFLPPAVHEYFLGKQQQQHQTSKNLTDTARIQSYLFQQRIPALTIYVVVAQTNQPPSTNGHSKTGHYLQALQHIFGVIPHRIYFLSGEDFVGIATATTTTTNAPQSPTTTLGLLASLKAIWDDEESCLSSESNLATASLGSNNSHMVTNDKPPVLFVHADEHVVSYVATTRDGNILGEGRFPGLASQWEAMDQHMEGLPRDQWHALLLQEFHPATQQSSTPSFFSKNGIRPRTLLNGMIQTLQTSLLQVEAEWAKRWSGGENTNTHAAESSSSSPSPRIVIDGAHSQLVQHLLLRSQPGADCQQRRQRKVMAYRQPLAHFGIAAVLREKALLRERQQQVDDKGALGQMLLGQRLLHARDELGTVVAVIKGLIQDYYRVQYDRGHWRDYVLRELPAELQRFHVLPNKDSFAKAKQEASYAASQRIVESLEQVKPALQKRRREPEGSQPSPKKLATNGDWSSNTAPIDLTVPSENGNNVDDENAAYVGRRVAKFFDNELFFGTIKQWKPPTTGVGDDDSTEDLWFVVYDDSDAEDMDKGELALHLDMYEEYRDRDDAQYS